MVHLNWKLARSVALLALSVFVIACNPPMENKLTPPVAKKVKKEFNEHNNSRIDNYYWLNDREDQEVIDYLEAENAYTDAVLKKTEALQEKIYNEIVGRIKQTDMSVPYDYKGYEYYVRFEEGGEYPLYCRKQLPEKKTEEVMLNGNTMAEGYAFFQIGGWEISHNNQLLAYSIDTVSRRKYTIHFKDLKSGKVLEDNIPNTSGNMAWANDNKTLYYATRDETLRPYRIYKHTIGSPAKDDVLVYEESDATFSTFVYKTGSDKFLVIGSHSTLSNEYRILDADKKGKKATFKVFHERQPTLEYSISHQGDRFLVLTNDQATNFKLMETPDDKTGIENWKEVIAHREDVLLEGVDVFEDFYVLSERKDGLPQLRILDQRLQKDYLLPFDEEDYNAYTTGNHDYSSRNIRYAFTSLKTPTTIYDMDVASQEKTFLKEYEVLGGYNANDYVTERRYAEARDGVKVPISIVYKKGFEKDGKQPLLLYAYGSYGYSIGSNFRSSRLSLLDRGFALAIAHVRGGQELGRQWYEDGKLLKKKNTFYDFIDCGKYLIEEGYTSSESMFAMGGSAGGLLVGAVINYEPLLFKGAIAAVPFVDVVTTMMDESIPLTTGEYDEWGNPNDPEYYDYILSYSPYDQVEAKEYTNLLVTTGLHDSQVQYWEPAKWVAKLRGMKTDDNILLLKTNMDFGHGGASGRFETYKETALEDAFMLMLLGIEE